MHQSFKAAAAQLAPVYLDRDRTVDKACDAIRRAGEEGARLIVFPEAFLPGYPYFAIVLDPTEINSFLRRLYEQAVEIPSPAIEALSLAAKEAGSHVVMGLNERDGGTLYNTQVFIGPDGQLLGKRRKLMPTAHERMVWGRGDGTDLRVYPTELGVLGGLICYEHANALFRYAIQGQREAIHVAGWPGGLPSINSIIDAATRHYAFEAQAFVISVTSVLTASVLETLGTGGSVDKLSPGGGYSTIISPRGEVLAGPEPDQETILYATLDPQLIMNMKTIVDTSGHYARPDVVRLVIRGSPLSSIEYEDGPER